MSISNSFSRNSQINYKTNFRGLALLIAVSIIFFVNNLVFAQGNWEDNTSNPKTWTTGKVGIGTNNPQELLHINGAIRGYDSIEGMLRINTGHGFLDIGPKNTGYSHFYTDRSKFYFNKPIYVNSGMIGSYHTNNLSLHTHGTARMTILNPNGNVGVGLENPLTYTAGYYTPIDFLYKDSANPTARIAAYHDGSGSKLVFGTSNSYASGITNSAMTIDRLGKVGIGTSTPGKTLDVMGGAAFQGNHIYLRNTASPVNNQTWGMVVSSSNGQFNLGPASDTPPSGGSLSAVPFILQQGAPNYSFMVNSLGNVGIGTPNPQSKLAVNGKVTCKEVEVTLSGWADFVFADDYDLMPLEKVEQHIQKNKHLPDIPSEKEVLESGVNLGEMQTKLLQKVEELTLYMIALQKENEWLKERVSSLEK
jgi:hypothetical protein